MILSDLGTLVDPCIHGPELLCPEKDWPWDSWPAPWPDLPEPIEIPEELPELLWAVPPIQKPIFQTETILPIIVIGLIGIVAISMLTK